MTQRNRRLDPLVEINRSQLEEIKKYKWIESEKAGRDIGWARAQREWFQQHFPKWKRSNWERAVKEAMADNSLN